MSEKNNLNEKRSIKKSKMLIIIGILSIILISVSFYFTYFLNGLYFKDFKEEESINVFKKYKEIKEQACYGNKIRCKKISYKVKGSVDTNKVGIYNLTYIINYKNETFKQIKKIKVVDKEKPTINIEGQFDHVCPSGKIEDAIVTAKDNYDGDITDKIKYKINGNVITYKVKDSSGNVYKKEFKSKVDDVTSPQIVLNGDDVMYLGVSKNYEEQGFVAIDNCDGDITSNVTVEGSVDSSKKGDYTLTYKVKDSFGNEAVKQRTVKVFERNNYKPEALGDKVIYLTFDDGPGPYTAQLLDILKKYDVKVTFFVTGYNNNFNDLLKREYDEGHTVALHSYTHDYSVIYTGIDAYMDDLIRIQNKVKEYTNFESKIIRFPGGSSNTISRKYRVNIMSELTSKVEELGFRYFDWTISSGDAGNTTDTNAVISNVINGIKPGKTNVVLQHDIKGFSVDAVESIIQYGLSNGYVFAPLTMDSPVTHQQVNN